MNEETLTFYGLTFIPEEHWYEPESIYSYNPIICFDKKTAVKEFIDIDNNYCPDCILKEISISKDNLINYMIETSEYCSLYNFKEEDRQNLLKADNLMDIVMKNHVLDELINKNILYYEKKYNIEINYLVYKDKESYYDEYYFEYDINPLSVKFKYKLHKKKYETLLNLLYDCDLSYQNSGSIDSDTKKYLQIIDSNFANVKKDLIPYIRDYRNKIINEVTDYYKEIYNLTDLEIKNTLFDENYYFNHSLTAGPTTEDDFEFSDKIDCEMWLEYKEPYLYAHLQIPNFEFMNEETSYNEFIAKSFFSPEEFYEMFDNFYNSEEIENHFLDKTVEILNEQYSDEFEKINDFANYYCEKYNVETLNDEENLEEEYTNYKNNKERVRER